MNIIPKEDDFWSGIGGHFDSFPQILNEFVDNSVSNFEGLNPPIRNINIQIAQINGGNKVSVKIEDTGTGIRDFEPALRLGDKSEAQSPLNEHGFGLKHALAAADIENRNWKIYSRTKEEFSKGIYRCVSAPYKFADISHETLKLENYPWPGSYNGTGTLIEFVCPINLLYTARNGISGKVTFDSSIEALREELGYVYSGIIKEGKASVVLQSRPVSVMDPVTVQYYPEGRGTVKKNLGGGEVEIEYSFEEIGESGFLKHYKRNMATSGVEIRVNGRILVSNIFEDVWRLEPHPSYNKFLVQINLKSTDIRALPKTKTSKNGIRSGDEKLNELYKWIISKCPKPHKEEATILSGWASEKELVKKLATLKEKQIRNKSKTIKRELEVYKTIEPGSVFVDLYVFDGSDTVIYEAKKNNATIQDLYQLLMCWDGAVRDNIRPTEGILLAQSFSRGAEEVIQYLNSRKDQKNNNYNFSKKTWADEGMGSQIDEE